MIKRKGRSQIPNLTPNYKSLEIKGQMRSDWSVLYTIGNIFSRAIRYYCHTFKINLIWKRYERPKFWNNKSPSSRTIRVPVEKWHLDVISIEKHIAYYREGGGASSQKLQAAWSLKLSLLSMFHHFHSTYTNCPLFLVVQVGIILNFWLWVHPSPILKLQHTLLPLKCHKLRSMAQLFFSYVVSFLEPTLGLLRSLGVCHIYLYLLTYQPTYLPMFFTFT
jgi:hypothetical protein